MRTLGTRSFMRAALLLSLAAGGCGKSASGGDDTDAGTGGQAAGGQSGGGENTGGQGNGGQNAGGENAGGQNAGGENMGGQNAGGSSGEGLPLGAECETPPFCQGNDDDPAGCCTGGADDSEACQTGGCRSGVCTRRFSELIGICTRDCQRDSACENFTDGPLGSSYVCVHDDTDGLCMPGSNQRCDGSANGECPDGEICTFSQTFSADAQYGGLCQPPRPGAGVGEPCNDDEGQPCANGMCLLGKCSTFCDPTAETSPCTNGQICFDDFSLADGRILLDICLPGYCEKNSDCGENEVCGITLDFTGQPYIVGFCQPIVEGEPQVGDVCPAGIDFCGGGNLCLNDYCSGFCDTDADCPNGACSVISLLLDSVTMQTAQAQVCVSAPSGSGRECDSNDDCAAAGDIPAEACDLVIRGTVTGGRPQDDMRVTGRCVAIPANAVAPGEACSEAAPCATENLCNDGYCSQLCAVTANCGAGAYCGTALVSDNDTPTTIDDLYTGLCIADTGSLGACDSDADCPVGTEFCRANVLLQSGTPTLETFCSANTGLGMVGAGAECARAGDCVSGRCNAWSRVVADPGYCFGLCATDADCSADGSVTCEDFLAYSGDEGAADDVTVKGCVPMHVCASCDFADGARPCAGDTTCSLVDFAGGRAGGACLESCGAGGACPDGFACQPARDAAGAQAGGDVCVPVDADETCRSARPLR
jgi:hypothetical protein